MIADLDAMLAESGEDIVLRRINGTGNNTAFFDVECRASVRPFAPDELVGTIVQTDSRVILSPTEITAAGWPGPGTVPAQPPAFDQDTRVPKVNDTCIIQGKARKISFSKPILAGGELVRIELSVAG